MNPTATTARDEVRIAWIGEALKKHDCDAIVCSLPQNVVMLSGYWPVVGTSIAVATREGEIHLIVPEDERDLASKSCAADLVTFQPASLACLTTAAESALSPLRKVAGKLGNVKRVAFELQEASAPASYAAMHLYRGQLQDLVHQAFAGSAPVCAQSLLRDLRRKKSPNEIARIRVACDVARRAFAHGAAQLRAGLTEVEAAALFRAPLSEALAKLPDVERADGFVFCMSGPNSAKAFGAYARSRARKIMRGDLVLMHCNSYCDGLWTDITRTYHMGEPGPECRKMYTAVFAARDAAFRNIRAGVTGAEVDQAARSVLRQHGFGREFKHSTGHGVGFQAISADARPRLHPNSRDELAAGMVFNVEPAIYIEGRGGLRHCDMVVTHEETSELLTPFHSRMEELVIDRS